MTRNKSITLLHSFNGELIYKHALGHSHARSLYCDFGPWKQTIRELSILGPLMDQASKAGVRLVNYVAVIQLVKKDGTVIGAVGLLFGGLW